jgi:hypothetical protein
MTQFHSLRRRVAAALHSEGGKAGEDFHAMSPERQRPWLEDADRVIPIVIEACAGVADARDPEKPANYLIRREHIGSHMKGLFVGHPDWECPLGLDDCFQNCGNLVEALAMAVQAIDELGGCKDPNCTYDECLPTKVRAALAKYRGQDATKGGGE